MPAAGPILPASTALPQRSSTSKMMAPSSILVVKTPREGTTLRLPYKFNRYSDITVQYNTKKNLKIKVDPPNVIDSVKNYILGGPKIDEKGKKIKKKLSFKEESDWEVRTYIKDEVIGFMETEAENSLEVVFEDDEEGSWEDGDDEEIDINELDPREIDDAIEAASFRPDPIIEEKSTEELKGNEDNEEVIEDEKSPLETQGKRVQIKDAKSIKIRNTLNLITPTTATETKENVQVYNLKPMDKVEAIMVWEGLKVKLEWAEVQKAEWELKEKQENSKWKSSFRRRWGWMRG